jgi:hypothetical protein
MFQCDLDIPFKGHRTYLQSANAWDSVAKSLLAGAEGLSEFADSGTVLDLTFRSLIGEAVSLHLSRERLKLAEAKAQLLITSPDKTKAFGALVPTGQSVESRIDDVENGMKPDVQIDGERAVYKGDIPMSLSQVYVALIKFWHQANVDSDCKWLATRLQLPLACLKAKPTSVTIIPETILKDGAGSVTRVGADDDERLSGRIWFYKT